MGKVIQVQFGRRQVPAKVIEAEAKDIEAIAERNIDDRMADLLERHNEITRNQSGSAATELLIIALAVVAIAAVVAATVAFPASVLLGTLAETLNF